MQFGNWNVTDNTLEWEGGGSDTLSISKDELTRTRKDNLSGEIYYEWILRATSQDWLTQDDLYDFNYAFVFAAAKFNVEFDYGVFDATLAEQYDQLDIEEDNDMPF